MARFEEINARPKKRLGQNFLSNPEALDQVVEAAGLDGSENVVEVGAGTGLLTKRLASAAKKVIAIELDPDLVPGLEEQFADQKNVTIQAGDVLGIDPAALPDPYVVVANVPYYITSRILRHFLETPHQPRTLTVTIQQEVAERICAAPPRMSVLAISAQLYGQPEIAGHIPRTAFWPAPEVDSAILRIDQITNGNIHLAGLSVDDFFRVVRSGFSEKRKQLHNSLARSLDLSHDEATALLESVSIEGTRRAETLTIGEWVRLATAYAKR